MYRVISVIIIVFGIISIGVSQQPTPKIRVGIWEFYDVNLFPKKNIWVNPKEIPGNNIDDDKNGFIDDVYGIGFDYLEQPTRHIFTPTYEDTTDLYLYFHGTGVGQVILRNYPDAELVGVGFLKYVERKYKPVWKENLKERLLGNPEEDVKLLDNLFQISVKYFKAQNVKVVNISWAAYKGVFKGILKDLGCYTKEIESKLDNEWLKLFHNSLYKVFKENPDIIFVIGAGNETKDIDEIFSVPAVIDLPNVITVGGLTREGNHIISFSNYGKNVKVYATSVHKNVLIAPNYRNEIYGTSFSAPVITAYVARELAKGKRWAKIKRELVRQRFIRSL